MNTEQADLSSLRIQRESRDPEGDRRKRKTFRSIVVYLIGIGAFVGLIFLLKGILFPSLITVEVTTAELRSPSEAQSLLSGSGYVVAQQKAAVASKATGQLIALYVKEGDAVKANQVLAKLQDNDIRAQVSEAEAQLSLSVADSTEAKHQLDRQKSLRTTSSISQAEVERAESAYQRVLASIQMALARLQSAKVALENTLIRAPFDGTVLTKNADVGEMVAPFAAGASAKAAVVTIANLQSLQLEADVSESNIEKIQLNGRCDIRLDAYPTQSYPGYVASIIPTADRSKGAVKVKIGFVEYDSRILPEMSAKVTFLKAASDSVTFQPAVLTVPESAVIQKSGNDIVYRVIDGKAVETVIQKGTTFFGFVEVRSGLSKGEQVIQQVSDKIKNRIRVETK